MINLELVEHVVGVFVLPTLARIGLGQARSLALQELQVSGICQQRDDDFGRTRVAALHQAAGKVTVTADVDDVVSAFGAAGDRGKPELASLSRGREQVRGDFLERAPLYLGWPFIDIDVHSLVFINVILLVSISEWTIKIALLTPSGNACRAESPAELRQVLECVRCCAALDDASARRAQTVS